MVNKTENIRVNTPKVLSVKEAASYLTVSERNLRGKIAERDIPYVKLGKRILIRLVDLDRYIDSNLCA